MIQLREADAREKNAATMSRHDYLNNMRHCGSHNIPLTVEENAHSLVTTAHPRIHALHRKLETRPVGDL